MINMLAVTAQQSHSQGQKASESCHKREVATSTGRFWRNKCGDIYVQLMGLRNSVNYLICEVGLFVGEDYLFDSHTKVQVQRIYKQQKCCKFLLL